MKARVIHRYKTLKFRNARCVAAQAQTLWVLTDDAQIVALDQQGQIIKRIERQRRPYFSSLHVYDSEHLLLSENGGLLLVQTRTGIERSLSIEHLHIPKVGTGEGSPIDVALASNHIYVVADDTATVYMLDKHTLVQINSWPLYTPPKQNVSCYISVDEKTEQVLVYDFINSIEFLYSLRGEFRASAVNPAFVCGVYRGYMIDRDTLVSLKVRHADTFPSIPKIHMDSDIQDVTIDAHTDCVYVITSDTIECMGAVSPFVTFLCGTLHERSVLARAADKPLFEPHLLWVLLMYAGFKRRKKRPRGPTIEEVD